MYGVRDREAGNVIEIGFSTEEAAKKKLDEFEEKDKQEYIYEKDFYEVFYQKDIYDIKIKYNMSIKEISDRFNIPYRTVQNWSANVRKCPEYILNMMDEILTANIKTTDELIDELYDLVEDSVASWTLEKQQKFKENEGGYKNSIINDSSYAIEGIKNNNRSEIINAVIALFED